MRFGSVKMQVGKVKRGHCFCTYQLWHSSISEGKTLSAVDNILQVGVWPLKISVHPAIPLIYGGHSLTRYHYLGAGATAHILAADRIGLIKAVQHHRNIRLNCIGRSKCHYVELPTLLITVIY